MVVIVVCALLLATGLLGVVRWGGTAFRTAENEPQGDDPRPSPATVARRFLRSFTLAVVGGVGAGVLVAGAGGRLVMRLLAATSGDAAQGRTTEADEVVGRITAGGSVGFVLFAALFLGAASGVLYLLVRRWLPAGRLGGVVFGALLLVLLATRVDPLRPDNPDFGIVGPGWVALAAFGALVLVHGMLVAALVARYSGLLPLVAMNRRTVVAHLPLLLLAPLAPVFLFVALVGALWVAISQVPAIVGPMRSRRALVAGRVMLLGAAVAALPSWISAMVDIA